jgi:hypothetical protein
MALPQALPRKVSSISIVADKRGLFLWKESPFFGGQIKAAKKIGVRQKA